MLGAVIDVGTGALKGKLWLVLLGGPVLGAMVAVGTGALHRWQRGVLQNSGFWVLLEGQIHIFFVH